MRPRAARFENGIARPQRDDARLVENRRPRFRRRVTGLQEVKLLDSLAKNLGAAKALAGLLLLLGSLPVLADTGDMIITPYAGAYWGNADFEEAASGSNLDIEDTETIGLILGWEMEDGQFELSYSMQSTEFDGSSSVSSAVEVDVDIQNLLVGGKLTLDAESGAYLSFLLGLSEIDIDADELNSDTRPALGFGGGIDRPISDNLGFRVGLRVVATILDTDKDGFCDSSSNCPIEIDSGTLVQTELFAGIGIRF